MMMKFSNITTSKCTFGAKHTSLRSMTRCEKSLIISIFYMARKTRTKWCPNEQNLLANSAPTKSVSANY